MAYFLQQFTVFVTLVALLLPSVSMGKAPVGSYAKEEERLRTQAKAVMKQVDSTDKIALMLAADKSASADALRPIVAEVEAGAKEAGQFNFDIKKDEIYFNGKATGIKIVSYQPFQLKYGNERVTLTKDQSVSERFRLVLELITGKKGKSGSLYDFLFPSAVADTSYFNMGMGALIAGGVAAVASVLLTGGLSVALIAMVAGAGGTVGYLLGTETDKWKIHELMGALRKNEISLSCSDGRAVLLVKMYGKTGRAEITYNPKFKGSGYQVPSVEVTMPNGDIVSDPASFDAEYLKNLRQLAQCRNNDQAKQAMADLRKAATIAFAAKADPKQLNDKEGEFVQDGPVREGGQGSGQ